jgi:hypothetical protein
MQLWQEVRDEFRKQCETDLFLLRRYREKMSNSIVQAWKDGVYFDVSEFDRAMARMILEVSPIV